MPLQWRLTLDEPYAIATEPGIAKAVHCRNFRTSAGAFSNAWRDENTGLVMLAPSWTEREWYSHAKTLSQFRHATDYWRQSKRTTDLVSAFTSVRPAGTTGELIAIAIDTTAVMIEQAAELYDKLVWSLESTWLLDCDEGFAIYLSNLDDELKRKKNWLYLQWANIGLHIGQGGVCRVYRYGADMTATPTQVYEFLLCAPSELGSGRGSWFVFIPIPLYGLLCLHSARPPKHSMLFGSAESQTVRGHVVPFEGYKLPDGTHGLLMSSPLRLAMNPYQHYQMSIATVAYPSSGTYTDAPFDPGYKPSADPSVLSPVVLPTAEQGVTAELRNAENSATWAAGTDRKARTKLTLTTANTRHTPFVQGYGIVWDPVIETRDTTPVTASVRQLELTDDSEGRFEGTANILATSSAVRAICNRGDATFLLESSDDDGETWTAERAGLAKQFRLSLQRYGRGTQTFLAAECKLYDMMERLREGHMLCATAFDGMNVGDAINIVLRSGGFEMITVPEPLNSRGVPISKAGETWRYAVKVGDSGDEILSKLLLLGRRQHREWIATHNPDTWEWQVTERPRDMDTMWTLTADSDDHDPDNRIVRYKTLEMEPLPPECNVLRVCGITSPDPKGEKIGAYCINAASIEDTESEDYLGRVIPEQYVAEEALDQAQVNIIARCVEARAMHRIVRGSATMPEYTPELAPNCYVEVLDRDDTAIARLWIKRRTLTVSPAGNGWRHEVRIELESLWENAR